MDKETLSNYGWIVVLVLILAVMLALATPFGTFVAGAIKSTTAGLFSVNQAALGSAGIDVNDMVFENCDHVETEVRNVSDTYTGDTICLECGKVLVVGEKIVFAHNGDKVPEGGKYTDANGNVYNPGDAFPETVTTGDVYRYGDYEYKYNYYFYRYSSGNNGWSIDENINGWGVKAIVTNKSSYGAILNAINNAPIKSLKFTFGECKSMTSSPAIPDSVTSMENTFSHCISLTTAPEIPDSLTNMWSTFSGCTALTTAPLIPEGVTIIQNAFNGCTALSILPEGFVIPSSVIDMFQAFQNCSSLEGTIAVNANPSNYTRCFYNTQITAITGDTTKAYNLMLTKTSDSTNPK